MPFYEPVSSRPNLDAIERKIIEFWDGANIFERSVEHRPEENSFIFYEGPPTANGRPGIHHVEARTFKDLVCRYKTLRGYRVERNAGWDEHGLPVEIEVQKTEKLSTKQEIETFGVKEFNKKCKDSTQKYIKEWEDLTRRMGYWVNFQNAYRTSDTSYINRIWGIIKQLSDKDLLYRGDKIVPWACDSGTVVSQAEVALGYKDVVDESAYVKFTFSNESALSLSHKFKLKHGLPISMLAWTTTPWTLPSNMALAIGSGIEYAICHHAALQEYVICSLKRWPVVLGEGWSLVHSTGGQELLGLKYHNLFGLNGAPCRVILDRDSERSSATAGFVEDSESTGTGIVHIAPAFGEDDLNAYRHNAIEEQILQLIDETGVFIKDAPEFLQGESIFNLDSKTGSLQFNRINKMICNNLKQAGQLFKTERYEHSYPHNWRTGNPLIYFLRPSWYIATQMLKDRLIAANNQITWHPEHIKAGRFGNWLENNRDWSISRERYWGTPLPIWVGRITGKFKIFGSIEELLQQQGLVLNNLETEFDPHKPNIDQITFEEIIQGDDAGVTETYVRTPEVLDCWFDSGAMPMAAFDLQSPSNFQQADFICEAIDQTRGWFYSLLALGVALDDRPSYKRVLCLGHILDKDGQKMSKSKGNVVNPNELFTVYGADAVRWYMVAGCSAGNPIKFDVENIAEVLKRFLLPLWNTYSFYVLYGNLDGVDANYLSADEDEMQPIDRWLFARLKEVRMKATKEYEEFEFSKATLLIEKFVDDLSNIWVRANRKRFWNVKSTADSSAQSNNSYDAAAYLTLREGLIGICQMACPMIPFITEEIYRNLRSKNYPDSIHLTDWLEPEPLNAEESELLSEMQLAQEVINQGRALRQQLNIKIRQPLAALDLPPTYSQVQTFTELIKNELNVKTVNFNVSIDSISFNTQLTDELLGEGLAREFIHAVQAMRKNAGFEVSDRIELMYNSEELDSRDVELLSDNVQYICNEVLAIKMQRAEIPNPNPPNAKKVKLNGKNCIIWLERIN